MAVLGMRPLFFVLAGAVAHFRYLQYGLAAVLGFVGFKMISEELIHIDTILSLGVIVAALGVSMLASWMLPDREQEEADGPGETTEASG
jgi:tellurite resistance protein TerC